MTKTSRSKNISEAVGALAVSFPHLQSCTHIHAHSCVCAGLQSTSNFIKTLQSPYPRLRLANASLNSCFFLLPQPNYGTKAQEELLRCLKENRRDLSFTRPLLIIPVNPKENKKASVILPRRLMLSENKTFLWFGLITSNSR